MAARPARKPTSPISTPGPRSISPARAGSASTPPPACSPARATSRSPPPPTRHGRADQRRHQRSRKNRDQIRFPHGRHPRLETPRVTLPYREHQWREIEALGRKIDEELSAQDVRLTMGGEPTFVSTTNRDGLEWNFTALSPKSSRRAKCSSSVSATVYATGALLHFGQGKWYPGEVLPRWAYGCYWRKDGEPIWNDYDLVAEPARITRSPRNIPARFLHKLAEKLSLDPKYVRDAYEDVYHYLFEEARLPYNVSALDAKIKSEEDRARLAKVFRQGLDSVVGHALPAPARLLAARPPLVNRPSGNCAPSGSCSFPAIRPWATACRSNRSLGHASDAVQIVEQDPTERRPRCPPRAQKKRHGPGRLPRRLPARPGRPARCQRRPHLHLRRAAQRHLHVFMPPTARRKITSTSSPPSKTPPPISACPCASKATPRPPTTASRISRSRPIPASSKSISSPPPTGRNWSATPKSSTRKRATAISARKNSSSTDGTSAPAAATTSSSAAPPIDSPLLRRPDLLRSLVGYWQNHPALSYLFSGIFLGPTSQMPRIDEARNDALYELQLAFDQVPDFGHVPPWLVDRIFRNILTDVTGNTHRAEFCIDKLFAPEAPSGRLGLLELRSFEMPPHARMSLTQQLLMRAMVPVLGKALQGQPRAVGHPASRPLSPAPLLRAGLQRRHRRPQTAGYPFKPEWFAPHIEFRFPVQGEVTYDGVELELRTALEPWHVLGEEGTPGGTVRYVDSSVEKLQVKLDNAIEGRHVVTCNGRRVPLHPTGTPGQFVAGVRLPRLATARGASPHHRHRRAAHLRPHRHLDRPFPRRMRLLRLEPRRPQLDHHADQRQRSRRAPPLPLPRLRPHAGTDVRAAAASPARADFPLTLDLRNPALWPTILQALVIAAAVLWIYWPALHGDWLWDDDQLVTRQRGGA
jgi:hypothetical protein